MRTRATANRKKFPLRYGAFVKKFAMQSDRDGRKRLKPIVNSFHAGHFYIFTGDITMFAYNRVETKVT